MGWLAKNAWAEQALALHCALHCTEVMLQACHMQSQCILQAGTLQQHMHNTEEGNQLLERYGSPEPQVSSQGSPDREEGSHELRCSLEEHHALCGTRGCQLVACISSIIGALPPTPSWRV